MPQNPRETPDGQDHQIDALLTSRLRASLWLVVGGMLVLSLHDLTSGPAVPPAVHAVRAAFAVVAFGLLGGLRVDALARRAGWLAVLAGVALCLEIAAVGILRQDPEPTPYLLAAVAMYAVAVIPYGLLAQLALVAAAELALLWNHYAVSGSFAGVASYGGVAAVVSFTMSLYLARELDRQRRAIADGSHALARSEAYFRSLIDKSSDLITVLAPDGTILYDSPTHERLLGYTHDERIGSNALALIHPDDRAAVLETIARGIRQPGQVATLEYRYRHANGSWRRIEALGRNLLDDPNVGAIVVNSRDITERHRMEAELRRSQTYLQTIFDHAPIAFYLNDLQGRIVDGNHAAAALTGYPREELIGTTLLSRQLFADDELARIVEMLAPSATEPLGPFQMCLRHRDGHLVTAEVRTIPIELDGQRLVLGIANDVTERERTAEELRVAEARHHRQRDALITLATSDQPGGDDLTAALRRIAEIDAETLNVARCSIWRYTPDRTTIECVDLYELAADRHSAGAELRVADYPAYFQSLEEMDVMAADDVGRDPRARELADGYLHPFSIGAMMDASIMRDGAVYGVLCHEHIGPPRRWTADEKTFAATMANVVSLAVEGWERRQAQRAQSRLTTILDATPDLVAMADARDHHVIYVNPAGRRIMGLGPADDVTRLTIADVHPEWAYRRLRDEGIPTAIRDGAWTGESTFLNRNGDELPVLMVLLAHRSATGEVERLSTVSRDITERKSFEAELLAAKQAAEAASLAKSEFLANMSHEIRTPLNGILGMTDLALQTPLNAEQREYLEMVAASGHALLTVINDVLDFSRIEAGKLALDPVPVDVRGALADALRPLAVRAHLKGLELAYEVRPDVPALVVIDPHRLRQVLINLVGNATKFTERGEVAIALTLESGADAEEFLHVSVRDTGPGIAAEKQQAIFQAFEQADTSTTRRHGGSGLGLTISRKLVEMMGGRIWVESEAGRGSTFHFTVRCRRAAPVPRPEPDATGLLAGLPVLVVDDNATTRRILADTLSAWRMRVTTADGGGAALDRLAAAAAAGQPFRLALIDAGMPGMDGFELAVRLAPQLAGVTIMLLSSADLTGEATHCRELGIATFLTKPVREAELRDALLATLAAPAGSRPAARAAAAPEPTRGRPLHVLLAEDNPVNQRLVVRLLQRRGHTTVVANNGREALDALAREGFDVVLMDVQMPELDGLEATAAIRARERGTGIHIPIIALTAHAMSGDAQRCLAAGMDDYLAKPIDSARLFSLLDTLPAGTAEHTDTTGAEAHPGDPCGPWSP